MKTKKLLLLLIGITFFLNANAGWTNKTMVFGGLTRSYRIYVSPNYNASDPASIVMALHGLGDNMTNFSGIGFNYIADTANIIVLIPQAVTDAIAGTAWNSGAGVLGYYPNSSVNDIGFLNALVDTTMAHYSIDPQRVYLCGFSMGGFMTYRMAIQSNGKFAAFASMSGTIGSAITTFSPGRIVPIAHFHGTADGTVAFTGNQYGLDPDSVISLWLNNNGSPAEPDTFHYADVAADGITVDRYQYFNGNPDADVSFYIMNGADHTVLFPPSNDINEPYEVWLFFRKHVLLSVGIDVPTAAENNFQFFPNPADDYFTLISDGKGTFEIFDMTGKLISSSSIEEASQIIDITKLHAGMYLIKMTTPNNSSVQKLLVN
jgi:polyhydroxybutyrate depolymerase